MPTPSLRAKFQVARGTNANLQASKADFREGELCYARDINVLYVKEGNELVPASSAGSTDVADGSITNSKVSATAAIAGTKIAPNFGSQNVVTTGNLTGGFLYGDGSNITNLSATEIEEVVSGLTIDGLNVTPSFGSQNVSTTGNVTGGFLYGDGSNITNLSTTEIEAVVSDAIISGGNVTPNFGSQNIVTTGNITGGYLNGNGSNITNLSATEIGGVVSGLTIDGTNVTPNFGSQNIATTGNVTGGFLYGNGSNITNLSVEQIQDGAAGLFTSGSHSGISFEYDDVSGKVNATVPPAASPITRSAVTQNVTVAAGATATSTIALPKSCLIYSVQINKECWFRLYNSTEAMSADSSRLQSVDPTAGAGVICEVVTTGSETVKMTPAPTAMNAQSVISNSYPIRVTNNGASSDLTVTISYVILES